MHVQNNNTNPNTTPWKSGSVQSNGLNFFYEEKGSITSQPILLIAGLGCQLTMWPEAFCDALVSEGYRVIRFDNRDIGLSDEVNKGIKSNIPLDFIKARFGLPIRSNYTLHDMAEDAAGVIKSLKLENTHVVGISMGGMIAQLLSAKHPALVSRLTVLMSSTNHPSLPGPSLNVLNNMFLKAPKDKTVQAYCDHVVRVFKAIGSPSYPTDEHTLRQNAHNSFVRSRRPAGVLRQTSAIMASGSIEKWTKTISAPTLVVHGAQDPLLKPACGKRVAKLVPHAKLELIDGMGHDLPTPLLPTLVRFIATHHRM